MIYAILETNGKEQLCCVDKIGRRAFPTKLFFERDLSEFCIESNRINDAPETMDELIARYDISWADDMALFFGGSPELGIILDSEQEWKPLIRLETVWSPLHEERGRSLLE